MGSIGYWTVGLGPSQTLRLFPRHFVYEINTLSIIFCHLYLRGTEQRVQRIESISQLLSRNLMTLTEKQLRLHKNVVRGVKEDSTCSMQPCRFVSLGFVKFINVKPLYDLFIFIAYERESSFLIQLYLLCKETAWEMPQSAL